MCHYAEETGAPIPGASVKLVEAGADLVEGTADDVVCNAKSGEDGVANCGKIEVGRGVRAEHFHQVEHIRLNTSG